MKTVAIIPARGGSKRIPQKNIRPFLDKPIIAYSIQTALRSKLFDRVLVSTDSPEIAAVASSYGAEAPFVRPTALSDDFTGTNAVVKHALQWLQGEGIETEYACCIYATAPMLHVDYLVEGFNKIVNNEIPYVFSVTHFEFPIQRSVKISRQGKIEPCCPELIKMRSQDLEEAFHDAGQFYWGRTNAFLTDVDIYASQALPVLLPRYLVQDIDTIEDWERAELMYQLLQNKKKVEKGVNGR